MSEPQPAIVPFAARLGRPVAGQEIPTGRQRMVCLEHPQLAYDRSGLAIHLCCAMADGPGGFES